MSEAAARLILLAAAAYGLAGLLFAVPFVALGVQRIDAHARGARVGFRLLILPGCVALWPLLLRRWWRGLPPPVEDNAHRRTTRPEERSR
jgi:hypothetical protein